MLYSNLSLKSTGNYEVILKIPPKKNRSHTWIWPLLPLPCKVNLWAATPERLSTPNGGAGLSGLRQAPPGFEHALSVDVTDIVGSDGGLVEEESARHIALHGNVLALATDHAIFLIGLRFDVKGISDSTRQTHNAQHLKQYSQKPIAQMLFKAPGLHGFP